RLLPEIERIVTLVGVRNTGIERIRIFGGPVIRLMGIKRLGTVPGDKYRAGSPEIAFADTLNKCIKVKALPGRSEAESVLPPRRGIANYLKVAVVIECR